jgi:hypothetical protein
MTLILFSKTVESTEMFSQSNHVNEASFLNYVNLYQLGIVHTPVLSWGSYRTNRLMTPKYCITYSRGPSDV